MIALSFSSQAAYAKTQTEALQELLAVQEQTIGFGESLRGQSDHVLNKRPSENRWSTLECLEHLNRYATHYLPLLTQRAASAPRRKKETYRPGLLGKPFAISMHPARREKKISSPKNMNPIGSTLKRHVVDQFIKDQRQFQHVLESLEGLSLQGSRISISVVPIVRLQLGDMLHTLIWHNARHTLQAEEALG